MNITCPACSSEWLDQGISGDILCHDCRKSFRLSEIRIDSGV